MKPFSKTFIFLILGILTSSQIIAQSSYLKNFKSELIPKFGSVESISKEHVSIYRKHKNTFNSEIFFSKNYDSIKQKRYKDRKLSSQIDYIFDSDDKLIKSVFISKIKLIGWTLVETNYKYDSTGLIEIKKTDKNGDIIDLSVYKNDSLKNPRELSLFDKNKKLLSLTLYRYDYKKNELYIEYYNSNKRIVDVKETSIKNLKGDKKFNEYGDVLSYKGLKKYYRYEYKYDTLGNWVLKKQYSYNIVGDKLKNKKLISSTKRNIKYRK